MRDAAEASLQQLLDTREEMLAEAERVGDGAQQQDAQELAAEACVELASIHVERDDHAAAVTLFQRALALQYTAFGEMAAPVLATLDSLATSLAETGDSVGAEKAHRSALPLKQALQGKTSQAVADCYNELSVLLQGRGDLEASEAEARAALDVYAAAALPARILASAHLHRRSRLCTHNRASTSLTCRRSSLVRQVPPALR